MPISDIIIILQWSILFFIIGIFFLPLTAKIFSGFTDYGYIFSKILGMALVSYLIFFLGITHIAPFTKVNILFIIIFFAVINFILDKGNIVSIFSKKWQLFLFEELIFLAALFFWSYIRSHQPDIHGLEKYMDFGFVNSILRSDYFPPKDMWFTPFPINYYYFGHLVTAVLTKLSSIPSFIAYNLMLATLFAFTFAGAFSIGMNLIYLLISKSEARNPKQYQNTNDKTSKPSLTWSKHFGHLNLFRISTRLLRYAKHFGQVFDIRILIGGTLTAFLVAFAGNLHAIYAFFKPYVNENPVPFWQLGFSPESFPNSYWYPNATRFIYNTIHEFPLYSFVVSDLHGHVIDIPFVLLTIAILLSLISKSEARNPKQYQNTNDKTSKPSLTWSKHFGHLNLFRISTRLLRYAKHFGQVFDIRILLLGFILAVMYMTNAWDGVIYFILTSLVLLYITFQTSIFSNEQIKDQKSKIKNAVPDSKVFKNLDFDNLKLIKNFKLKISNWLFLVLILGFGFILFSLPFSLNFKPFVSGIGVLCAPQFLTDIGKIGPFLFEASHCQKSPLWQLAILYGFFYFWVITFIINIFKNLDFDNLKLIKNFKLKISNLNISDIFVLILIALSTFLIILPEFIYAKDIYPAHYRANTMFKLVYEAFIMLSIVIGYIIARLITNHQSPITNHGSIYSKFVYWFICFIGFIGLFLVMVYPYFATNAYYGNLQTYYGLDGLKYLKNLYPNDYEAILWLNNNIKGQPVMLEAQGDSYTDYARVSANTGLPTVLGWTVHEWLWRGTYDIPAPRIPEVQSLYENQDIAITKNLLKKYNISLVFIGDLERQKYSKLTEDKFQSLGTLIYKNGQTKIYKINPRFR